jgi:hypothetical protein
MFYKMSNSITLGDTPKFAVESIERWCRHQSAKTYQNANEILILADVIGSIVSDLMQTSAKAPVCGIDG